MFNMFNSGNTLVKLCSRLRGLPRDMRWYFGSGRSHLKSARGARILLYHGICPHEPFRYNTLFVTLKTFELQLRLYKKYFNLVSLDDLYEQRISDKRFNICLTFDDGFMNNYKYVLPILEKYQVPAAFFVTGIRDAGYEILWNDVLCAAYKHGPEKFRLGNEEFIKGKDSKYVSALTGEKLVDTLRLAEFEDKSDMIKLLSPFRQKADEDYWMQMTAGEIRQLASSKWVTIGSHSYYHNDLAKIPVDELRKDLNRSKLFLEDVTGKKIKALAFPYGSYSKVVLNEAKNAGYSQLLATEFLFADDPGDDALRERLTINPFISTINQLHANITGNYK